MTLSHSTAVIVNPRSAGGRTARAWAELRRQVEAVLGSVQVYETEAPGHATELARAALRQGSRRIIAVGGDGTINEIVNGFFEGDRLMAPDVLLGIVPQGSGSDFCRTLGIPLEVQPALELIGRGAAKKIDLFRVRFETLGGESRERYGVNITSFGMGGAVAARAGRLTGLLGARLAFQVATLATTVGFAGSTVRLRLDEGDPRTLKITNIAVGNGQFHGGGMWACPRAALDDGLLDITVIHYLSLFEIVRDLPVLYNGRIYEHPKVEFHRATRLEASGEGSALIELDGEPVGRLPLEIALLPGALGVYVPA